MATTADILGTTRRRKIPAHWLSQYETLCSQRDDLLMRENLTTEEYSNPKLDDLAEAGAEEAQRNISVLSTSATRERISEVVDAILRIERGSYGVCEITGESIEPDRLQAVPWTRYSLNGQIQLEQQGLGQRVAMAPLESLVESETSEERDSDESE